MTAPIKAEAEDAALDDFVKELRRLRADEIVAEKGDLKQYGLDRPAAQWALCAGGKDVLRLVVGNPEARQGEGRQTRAATPSWRARTRSFCSSPKLSAKALDEYRSRKPWPTFDAVQVEKLTLPGRRAVHAGEERHPGTVAGKPEARSTPRRSATRSTPWPASRCSAGWPTRRATCSSTACSRRSLTIDMRPRRRQTQPADRPHRGRFAAGLRGGGGRDGIFVLSEEDAQRSCGRWRPSSRMISRPFGPRRACLLDRLAHVAW